MTNIIFNFSALPDLVQSQILDCALLAPITDWEDPPVPLVASMELLKGTFSTTFSDDSPNYALLHVCRKIRYLSQQVLFSNTILILADDDPLESLEFLKSKLDAHARSWIRMLNLRVPMEGVVLCHRTEESKQTWLRGWSQLIEFIASNLTLPDLHLSVDHGDFYEYSLTDYPLPADKTPAVSDYRDIIKPFGMPGLWTTPPVSTLQSLSTNDNDNTSLTTTNDNHKKCPLASFHVYWIFFFWHEKESEQFVMGHEYNSELQTGKIPFTTRNPNRPQDRIGWPENFRMRERGKTKDQMPTELWDW